MAKSAGRDQLGPMERLIRIVICLTDAGPAGAPVKRLLRMADLHEDTEATRAQLRRDLAILRQGGWRIDNVATDGSDARYVLTVRDNRLAVLLTPGERAALRQLVADTYADRAAPPPFLGELQHAVADRCLASFTYEGRQHTVHPDALSATPSGWVLTGRDAGSGVAAEYVTAWMAEVVIDQRDTAAPPPAHPPVRLDPMSWQLDPPMIVTLVARPDFTGDVLRLLPGATVVPDHDHDQHTETLIEVRVTNQAAFHARLYALGLRARVVGPAELVAEIVDNLAAVAGGVDGDLR